MALKPDLELRQQEWLGVLEGVKFEVEHVYESTYVYQRGLGSSVGLYISTCQLFFLICQILLCLLTGSLAAACGMGKGTCLNCTGGLSSAKQPYSRWKMLEQVACVYESFYFEIYPADKVLAHASWICKNKIGTVGQSDCGHKEWSLQPCICFYTPFIDFINSTVSHYRYSRISPRLLCFNGMPQHCCCSPS